MQGSRVRPKICRVRRNIFIGRTGAPDIKQVRLCGALISTGDVSAASRLRRVTAVPRSPLLIAAILVNESISTGRTASQQRPRSGAPQPQSYLYVAFNF